MGETAAHSVPCQHRFSAVSRGSEVTACKLKPKTWIWKEQTARQLKTSTTGLGIRSSSKPHQASSSSVPAMSSAARSDMVTFSSNVSTDVPLYQPPGVSFDEYLSDRPRIFRAMFPDKRRSQRLNDEEWRIQMLPLQFLFASVNPVVVMRLRCKSNGQGYPRLVPLHVGRVLELQATKWELQGLDAIHMPSKFSLSVQGLLYSEQRKGGGGDRQQSRLKGHLELSISLVLPALLALVPEDVLRGTAELVLKRLVETMKQEVHGGVMSDFRSFGREKLMKQPSSITAPTDQQRR